MCRLCGREACAECFQQVSELTTERPDAPQAEIAALQAKREKHAHVNPFFLSCTRRNEHRASDFSPMSRFSKEELTEAIAEMEALLAEPEPSANGHAAEASAPEPTAATETTAEEGPAPAPAQPTNSSPDVPTDAPALSLGAPSPDPDTKPVAELSADSASAPEPSSFASAPAGSVPQDPFATGSLPTHTPRVFTDAELTDELFASVWAKGEPLVVTDLLAKFQLPWTPEYFSQKYGTQTCLILECQTDQNKRVSVGEFFSWFGKYEGRRDCWKLKVWRRRVLTHARP